MSQNKNNKSYLSKALVACGVSGLSGLGASTAEADIVAADSLPGVPAAETTINVDDPTDPSFIPVGWDVDGDGVSDFKRLRLQVPSGSTNASFLGGTNGGELAALTGDLGKFATSNAVGSGNDFTTAFLQITKRTYYSSFSDRAGSGADANWVMGETGNFGFKFTIGSNTHYGWGKMTLSPGANYEITEAYYETDADTGIHIGSTPGIPEPSSAALLSLGVAGLAMWRRRKRESRSAAR